MEGTMDVSTPGEYGAYFGSKLGEGPRTLTTEEAVDELERSLRAFADKLVATAAEIDAETIHPAHVANRLRKMARELGGQR
jgi:hypothetical protein